MISAEPPAESVLASGSVSRLLRILEKIMRTKLAEALPQQSAREAMLKGFVTPWVCSRCSCRRALLPREARIHVRTLDCSETSIKATQTFSDALVALREWHQVSIAQEAFQTGPEPHKA